MGEKFTQSFVGETKGQGLLGRACRKWKSNIKMDVGELGCNALYLIYLAQDRGHMAGCYERGEETSVP